MFMNEIHYVFVSKLCHSNSSLPCNLRQGQVTFAQIQQGLLCKSRLKQMQCVFTVFCVLVLLVQTLQHHPHSLTLW